MSAEANPALQQLGRRLAQAREASGLSLEEHADRLNMGREQLQALEAGNRDDLPEPVFVIAQARRVATSLGIEIDEEIAALRGSDGFQIPRAPRSPGHAQNREVVVGAGPQRPIPRSKSAGTGGSALRTGLLALIAVLAAAAALIGLRQALPRRFAPQASPPAPMAATEATPEATPEAEGQAADQASGAAAPTPRDELVLKPSEPSWVEVRSADGTTLFRGTLETEQRFPLNAELEVLAGRPDLVLVRLGPSPAGPMGTIDDVRWRRFRADAAPSP